MKIARVFPRRTRATPTDDLAFVGEPGLFPPEVDVVHISVAFTWDLPEAERLERVWRSIAPTKIGGPATGMRGEEFTPGMYLKPGYVITSRGCPNHCWFCSVPNREGNIRELPITNGCNILDDNFLACSQEHIFSVFDMLRRQNNPIQFTGGLEAARLKDWHIVQLSQIKPKQIFFAYDTEDDYEPLVYVGKELLRAGFTIASHALRCFVLIGYPRDTFDKAEQRLIRSIDAGFTPMAMLWRDDGGTTSLDWRKFQRRWAKPAIIHGNLLGGKREPHEKA
jgi:hypothetical protein